MLSAAILRTISFCTRRAWSVILAAAVLAAVSFVYAATHFAIDTDVNRLIPDDLAWRQRQLAYEAAFPPRKILAVVQAPTPELAESAAAKLTTRLSARRDLFASIREPQAGAFFKRDGLLFLPLEQVQHVADQLTTAKPLLGLLAGDPSLRGVAGAISLGETGVERGYVQLDSLVRPMTMLADTLSDALSGRFASFSWRSLLNTGAAPASENLRFLEIEPILDFKALQPGLAATGAIRQAAADLALQRDFGASVRLTGLVPINDEAFASLSEGAALNTAGTVVVVLIILWLALRSLRIILAVALGLVVGFAVTAALGLLMVGAFNLISIAFAVLFIGLGADFGIQLSVRYRAERHEIGDLGAALRSAAAKAGGPLALAAAGTAAGFLSFLPTAYRGVSELGQIAGLGMIIAFLTTITLLPALLEVLNPPGEPHPMGFRALAPVDRFMARHRVAIVVGTVVAVLGASPLLLFLRFDFNPVDLQNRNSEAVATYLALSRDPETGIYAINVLAPSLADANRTAARLAELPEVSQASTLQRFVPEGQTGKLAAIEKASASLEPVISPPAVRPPPTDAETRSALQSAAARLQQIANSHQGPGAAAASRLASLLLGLVEADDSVLARAQAALVTPLRTDLDDLRQMLRPQPVTLSSLPPDLVRDWMTPDGRARVQVLPKGNANDIGTLRRFATAVLRVAPNATGVPVSLIESAHLVIVSFIEAGVWAILAVAVILLVTLRRVGDVLLTLVPLIVAGAVTLEICVAIGLPLNFANIIALPLLLGVGVAFKIYYIMAWRRGATNLLQSTLTRAVFFSALTTATAFGSLWLSNEPGMSSMGELMALALLCTLAAAVLFQPALMGPPRDKR